MKLSEIFAGTFKTLRHELGHDRPRDSRPVWQQRLSADSCFCRAVVANGYLTETQVHLGFKSGNVGHNRGYYVVRIPTDERKRRAEQLAYEAMKQQETAKNDTYDTDGTDVF